MNINSIYRAFRFTFFFNFVGLYGPYLRGHAVCSSERRTGWAMGMAEREYNAVWRRRNAGPENDGQLKNSMSIYTYKPRDSFM